MLGFFIMTELLDQAIAKTKNLSPSRQDEVGALLMDIVEQETSGLHLSPAQQAEIRRRLSAQRDVVPTPKAKRPEWKKQKRK
jgi:hypothetical protein